MRRLMRPKRPASQWPHIVCLTLSSQLLHALQRAAGSLVRMRKPHEDTGGHRTLRIATRAARRHAHESIQARDHAVAAINPATNLSLVPLKRWFGASRAQSMHTGTCSTLGRLAASQPAPTDALAGFSEHVSREHVTSAGPHRFVIERCFTACTATVSPAVRLGSS